MLFYLLLVFQTLLDKWQTVYNAFCDISRGSMIMMTIYSMFRLSDVYFTTLQLVLVPCGVSPYFTMSKLYFVSFGITGPIVESLKMVFCSCIR